MAGYVQDGFWKRKTNDPGDGFSPSNTGKQDIDEDGLKKNEQTNEIFRGETSLCGF